MRHRMRGRKFGRKTGPRIALKRNLLKSLILHRRVRTTLAKAKEYRRFAEKLITLAREPSLAKIRRAAQILGNDKAVVKVLFHEIAPLFRDEKFPGGWRPGGYTRILKLQRPRLGDAAPVAILELVGESERRKAVHEQKKAEELAKASPKKKRAARKKKGAPKEEAEAEKAGAAD